MAEWQRKIYLQPEWDQSKDGEITIQVLAGVVASRLKECAPLDLEQYKSGIDGNAAWANNKREELIEEFESMADDTDLTVDDFDSLMNDLYDWGDTPLTTGFFQAKKVCFIDWMSPREATVMAEAAS